MGFDTTTHQQTAQDFYNAGRRKDDIPRYWTDAALAKAKLNTTVASAAERCSAGKERE